MVQLAAMQSQAGSSLASGMAPTQSIFRSNMDISPVSCPVIVTNYVATGPASNGDVIPNQVQEMSQDMGAAILCQLQLLTISNNGPSLVVCDGATTHISKGPSSSTLYWDATALNFNYALVPFNSAKYDGATAQGSNILSHSCIYNEYSMNGK